MIVQVEDADAAHARATCPTSSCAAATARWCSCRTWSTCERDGRGQGAQPLQQAALGDDQRRPGAGLLAWARRWTWMEDALQEVAPDAQYDLSGQSREFRESVERLRDDLRAGAGLHLPGAGGAVRELGRSVRDPAGGAAGGVRRVPRAQAHRRQLEHLLADRHRHPGRPDRQARHPDRGVLQPAAGAGHDQARRGDRSRRRCACARS